MQDLTDLARDIESLVELHLDLEDKPSIALCLTLPPSYNEVHWVTNVNREQGLMLFKTTAEKMQAELN